MHSLIIDTSTEKAILVFARKTHVLLSLPLPKADQLFSCLNQGLIELGWHPVRDLHAIAVTLGPGSYTGIRVGLSAAKGLALPYRRPLVGFCTLAGFTAREEGLFASLIDAHREAVYVLLQERRGDQVIALSQPARLAKTELPQALAQCQSVVGPHNSSPDSKQLAWLAWSLLSQSPHPLPPPFYL